MPQEEQQQQPPRVKPALHNTNREELANGKKNGKEMKLESKIHTHSCVHTKLQKDTLNKEAANMAWNTHTHTYINIFIQQEETIKKQLSFGYVPIIIPM
jgi:hypothetical protein